MACLPDFCEAGRVKASRVQHCNCFRPEALQTRVAELRRKVRDEQQKQAPNFTCCQCHLCVAGQEVAQRKVSLVEDEVGLCSWAVGTPCISVFAEVARLRAEAAAERKK